MIKLGERMKELRLRDGRTQDALASVLGVTAQAVSRWEKGICYPDMSMIPSIANYFGISIDELFGYDNDREKKVDLLADQLYAMIRRNDGKDENMEECITLARKGLIEFPGNEKLTLALAYALFNAGYVRRGEHHIVGVDGYSVYDIERHRTYPEWQEAIKLYEKLLLSLSNGKLRQKAIEELSQLYKNTGEHEKALHLAEDAPDIKTSKPFLRIKAFDGKEAIDAMGEALLESVRHSIDMMIHIILDDTTIPPATAAEMLQNAEEMFELISPYPSCGKDFGVLTCIQMLHSYYLWLAEKKEDAFVALDKALDYAKTTEKEFSTELPDLWPWWDVPEREKVMAEMQADSRWTEWVEKTRR
ncbi:MAG: helix-turn-helix transcriptional regulator [Lachnospiraceae bacterium]|jgi:transcriptional regulator with XRE-family HTH domain|nr:helix-turn-helix transcriptional regulator [Lachnospiraceae bacterium]